MLKEPLNVKINPYLGEQLDMLAFSNGCTKSEAIGEILSWYFSQMDESEVEEIG